MNSMFQSVSDFISSHSLISYKKSSLFIGARLSQILHEYNHEIHIPRLVVVGTQSSGKTSVLNGIIGLPILPTGSTITTRTPIHIELCPSEEFCVYVNEHKIDVTNDQIEIQKSITYISDLIEMITNEYTKNTKNISHKPIYIKVLKNDLSPLYLIDLPGLTLVARTDEGQPVNIKTQIRKLVKSYINTDHTYILAIMAARADIETDMALELIKENDEKLERTIGILTKVDLLNESSSIEKYITQKKLCIDLKMKLQYICVRNFHNDSLHQKETNYFSNHKTYKHLQNKFSDQFGIISVRKKAIQILEEALYTEIPIIQNILQKHYRQVEDELNLYQNEVNVDNYKTILRSIISSFCFSFKEKLKQRGTDDIQIGQNIKTIFIKFRQRIQDIDPLLEFSDSDMKNIMQNVEGNHMTLTIPSIDTIEYIMMSKKKNPIDKLFIPMKDTIFKITKELKLLTYFLIENNQRIKLYPRCQSILKSMLDEYIEQKQNTSIQEIEKFIKIQKCYIWSDDEHFKNEMVKIIGSKQNISNIADNIRQIIAAYYETIIFQSQEIVPKMIMFYLVSIFDSENIHSCLFDEIINNYTFEKLFSISQEHENLKKNLVVKKQKLKESQLIIQSFLKR